MVFYYRLIIFICFNLFVFIIEAQPICRAIFNVKNEPNFRNYLLSSSSMTNKQLHQMASSLFLSNLKAILSKQSEEYRHLTREDRNHKIYFYNQTKILELWNENKIEILMKQTNEIDGVKLFKVYLFDSEKSESFLSFDVLVQGSFMMLHMSYQYRAKSLQNYNSVLWDSVLNNYRIISFNEFILSFLPEEINLSRSLSESELLKWKNKKYSELGSPFAMFYDKIHFAFNHYYFNKQPQYFKLKKIDLVKLVQDGLVEFNTYEFNQEDSRFGMKEISYLEALKFPIEVVFVRQALVKSGDLFESDFEQKQLDYSY